MLSEKSVTASHAGEDQASRARKARSAHWDAVASQLLLAAKTLANDHLQKQRDDIRACESSQHHQAVRNLFIAINAADNAGLSDACAETMAAEPAPLRDPRVLDMFETGGAA